MMREVNGPRVLLSAYQCGPGMGSVSQIGWHWYRRLAARVPTTLLTHARNRAAIDAAGGPVGDSRIQYVDTEWFAGPLYRMASRVFRTSEHAVFMVSSLDFYVYDIAATRMARAAMSDGARWDIVHAPTPVSPLAGTGLYRLGRPVVLGPWNGNLGVPTGFQDVLKADSTWLYPIRHLGRIVDAVRGGTRHAALILTATQATLEGIPGRLRSRCVQMLENGVELDGFSPAPWPAPPGGGDEPLRLVFVGRLVPFKGVGMLLDAVARLVPEIPVQLSVVGDGPMATEWRDQAARLGIGAQVRFLGNLAPAQVAEAMRAAHLFCLPSVRESGGAVLLEAMACARPVVAIGFGGPAEIVDDEVGCLLPATDSASVVDGLVATFRALMKDPDAWRLKGVAGRARVEARYSWDAKVDSAIDLYRELIAEPAGGPSVRLGH